MAKRFEIKDIERYTIYDENDNDTLDKEPLESSNIFIKNKKMIECCEDLGFFCSEKLRNFIKCDKNEFSCKGFNLFWYHDLECKKKLWDSLPNESFKNIFDNLKYE